MTALFHIWAYGRFIEIQRKKYHRTNWSFNFLGGSFSNRDNVTAPIQFRRGQSQHLKRWFFLKDKPIHFHINRTIVITVKLVLTTAFLKQPPVLNNHVVVFRSNFSLYSDHLYNVTNDHLNDVPGILLPACSDHCTKCLS